MLKLPDLGSSFNVWAEFIQEWRDQQGFYTPSTIEGEDGDATLGKLMLVVTEIAEAAEAVRKGDKANYAEELADAIIRILDLSHNQGIDIESEIALKMTINLKRPYKHGKKTNL